VPTYQYVCTECGSSLEVVQRFTDDALTVHDECGGRLRKVFSPVGIVFKGSGFYRTDSRGTGSSGAAPAKPGGDKPGSESAKPAESSSSSSGESKSGGDSSSSSSASSSSSTGAASSSSSGKSSGEKVA
jgi:putative FmdB family regulatory protein